MKRASIKIWLKLFQQLPVEGFDGAIKFALLLQRVVLQRQLNTLAGCSLRMQFSW